MTMTTKAEQRVPMRQQAEKIFRAALKAVDPIEAVFRYVKTVDGALQVGERRFEYKDYDRILVVGAGKAGAPMARALEDLLGDRISDGVIVVKEGHGLPMQHVRIHEPGHPVPDERGIRGASAGESACDDDGEKGECGVEHRRGVGVALPREHRHENEQVLEPLMGSERPYDQSGRRHAIGSPRHRCGAR